MVVANFILKHMMEKAVNQKNLNACIVDLAIGDIFPASVEINN